jgi:hypothetical protein
MSAVDVKAPPMALVRVLNPIMRTVLPTRFGRRLRPLAILELTGRRSGVRRRIAVGAHELDGDTVVFTDRPWRLNVDGGADVVLATGGQRRRGVAELVDDPLEVGPALAATAAKIGPRRLGHTVTDGTSPTAADYAATGKSMIRIRFT